MPSQVGGCSRTWQFLGRMTVCEHLLWSVGRYILISDMGVLFCKTWSGIFLRFLSVGRLSFDIMLITLLDELKMYLIALR